MSVWVWNLMDRLLRTRGRAAGRRRRGGRQRERARGATPLVAERCVRAEQQLAWARTMLAAARPILMSLGRGEAVRADDGGERARDWLSTCRLAGLIAGPDGHYRNVERVAEGRGERQA